jgi:hypothetical protein
MTPAELIAAAKGAGVTLRPRLWADHPDRLQPEIRAAIRADMDGIIRELVDPFIVVLCGRCGSSQRFIAIENPTGWTCSTCSPDWKYERDERFAIQTEGAELLERRNVA